MKNLLTACREFHSWKLKKTYPLNEGFKCLNFFIDGQILLNPFNINPFVMTVPAIQGYYRIPEMVIRTVQKNRSVTPLAMPLNFMS